MREIILTGDLTRCETVIYTSRRKNTIFGRRHKKVVCTRITFTVDGFDRATPVQGGRKVRFTFSERFSRKNDSHFTRIDSVYCTSSVITDSESTYSIRSIGVIVFYSFFVLISVIFNFQMHRTNLHGLSKKTYVGTIER